MQTHSREIYSVYIKELFVQRPSINRLITVVLKPERDFDSVTDRSLCIA
jgi:hypothetical protein